MKTGVVGFLRIGEDRELKFSSEGYFAGKTSENELLSVAKALRVKHWTKQKEAGLDFIPSGDFSMYDGTLDTMVMLSAVPERYKALNLSELDEYFACARGYQGEKGDVKALSMRKWFNTNYHYMVPEIEDTTIIKFNGKKILAEFIEAKETGIITKPVLIGPFTFLKLAKFTGKKTAADYYIAIGEAYAEAVKQLSALGAKWIQFDEPSLVTDLTNEDKAVFKTLYEKILAAKSGSKILLQTYFGDVRDIYSELLALDFDGIGLDFCEGKESLNLVKKYGFDKSKILFAGVVNGKNIWKNDYAKTLKLLDELKKYAGEIAIGTSCSLLHVPYSAKSEKALDESVLKHFAFALEKLDELKDLKALTNASAYEKETAFIANTELFSKPRCAGNREVTEKVKAIKDSDTVRLPDFYTREKIQREALKLPILPTTTIGSFPQTKEVKENRSAFKKGEISFEKYDAYNLDRIAECIKLQEKIGLDVLVHGEFERNDMVEYFGENLNGYVFTQKAWVQSYGTRCVKPPVIWDDVSRKGPITVKYIKHAQSVTDKPVKGMLTGPVTILNWSFPREDITLKESAYQIGLAIREEVLDLEANGIKIIQVDEAALREKLPLRKSDWKSEYLDWAIPAFRLVHSGVKATTQIHTHMCYSEFGDIIKEIDEMDADIISFEASRSDLAILANIKASGFKTQVGPGVYDIHSPRIPSVPEIEAAITKMLEVIPKEKLWINPDCGLKTRENKETVPSLQNLVKAAENIRKTL